MNRPFNHSTASSVPGLSPLPITHYLLLLLGSRVCFQLNEPNELNKLNELITHHSLQSSARKPQSEDSGQPAHTGIGRQCSFPW